MKKSLKLLSLFLSALMLTSSLTACSETTPETGTETQSNVPTAEESESVAEETAETLDDGLGNPDFGEYEFRILSCYFQGDEGAHRIMYEDYTGNPVNDALRDSALNIENRFHVKLSYISAGDEFATQTATQTSINAGDDAFDIVIGHDGLTFALAKEGLFYNMFDIEQFNFDMPWWPAGAVESLSLCDQLFCASSYISYLGLHMTRAMIINKDYASRLNVETPYDAVREGTWTIDTMFKYVEGTAQDLNGDGSFTTGTDEFGFCTGSQTFYTLQEAMDIPVYRRDSEGNVYMDFDIEKVDTYVSKWRNLINSTDYISSTTSGGEDIFQTGTVLLQYGKIGSAYDTYRDCDFSYGFLPTPKFDELQENYINCCTDMPWAIPKTVSVEQADIVGTICEALSCYNYQNVLPAYFEVAMKNRVADSPDDAEMLQLIADTRTISFAYSYGMTFNNILKDLTSSNTEVASYHKSNQKAAEKALAKLVAQFEEMKTMNDSGDAAE